MIHVRQTKLYDPGPPVFRGNCYAACVASVFEVPLAALPELHGEQDTGLNRWLGFHFPGVKVVTRDFEPIEVTEDTQRAWRRGLWLATVESPRFTEECLYHVVEGGTPLSPFFYEKSECPHCAGSGTRPGFHLVVCDGSKVAHDPHPAAGGYGWEYNGRLCGETWFEIVDPGKLIPRPRPVSW